MILVMVLLNAFDMIVIHLYRLFPALLYTLANPSRVTFTFICFRKLHHEECSPRIACCQAMSCK